MAWQMSLTSFQFDLDVFVVFDLNLLQQRVIQYCTSSLA